MYFSQFLVGVSPFRYINHCCVSPKRTKSIHFRILAISLMQWSFRIPSWKQLEYDRIRLLPYLRRRRVTTIREILQNVFWRYTTPGVSVIVRCLTIWILDNAAQRQIIWEIKYDWFQSCLVLPIYVVENYNKLQVGKFN